jgi:hypothetical protein
MTSNDAIKPAFLLPIKNLRITHNPNTIINEISDGKKMSCNGIS